MKTTILSFLIALAATAAAASGPYPAHPQTSPEITAADISARDKAISDDAFEGRGPGTMNGRSRRAMDRRRTETHRGQGRPITAAISRPCPPSSITLDPAKSRFVFTTPKGKLVPKFADETVYWTPQFAGTEVAVKNSPWSLSVMAWSRRSIGWNDYAGVDVKGKTVVILINDPGNEDAKPDPKFFKGAAMTYYGRWTYKYEEAARQGAAAAIIVHETRPAAYGWQVVRSSNGGPKLWLDAADKDKSMLPIEGWITLDIAKDLFARAGLRLRRAQGRRQQAAASRRSR